MFVDDIISYAKSSKDTTNSTNKFVASNKLHLASKIKTQTSIVFLSANREMSEKKFKRTTPLRIAIIIKYLVINVTKEVLHNENDKILMKENEEDTNKRKAISCS